MVSASSSAITRGWPNFNPGAFWPSAVTAGCTTLWMLSPLMPLLWLTRSTSSKRRLICRPIFCKYGRLLKPLFAPKSPAFRNAGDFGANKGLSNLPYLQKIGRQINRRLLEVERVSHNSGMSGDSIQRVVQPAVTADGQKAPGLKCGQPRVMALLLALTMFHHLIDGFRNRDLRQQVADLLGVTLAEYTTHQMTYDLRRLRLKGLIYRPPKTNRYFVTPYGWKVARLFSRLEARVFRPAMAMFTANDAVLPFPLRQALDRVDRQLDLLIYDAFPLPKAG